MDHPISTSSLEQAEPVEGPLVPEVIDRRTGNVRLSREILSGERSKVIELRHEVEAGLIRDDPVLLCAACETPLKVRASIHRRFFMRHIDESGQCEYKTRGAIDQSTINARKYQGQKEGRDHKELKAILARSLGADTRFSIPSLETTWRSIWSPGARRRPDVQTTRDGLRIAFEIQLSTTFIDVIAARREFYLREGGLLIWIFKRIDPTDRRMMEDDVFIPNNHNLFVADVETLRESERAGMLTLRCIYQTPSLANGNVVEEWHERLVTFDELTVDLPRQRVFFYDYRAAREAIAREQSDIGAHLRSQHEELWSQLSSSREENQKLQHPYSAIRNALRAMGLALPWYFNDPMTFYLLRACYCAKFKRALGYGYKTASALLQVAHNIHDGHKQHMYPFLLLLDHYGGSKQLRELDKSGVWSERRAKFEAAWRGGHPQRPDVAAPYTQDASHNKLLAFLFPEIATALL